MARVCCAIILPRTHRAPHERASRSPDRLRCSTSYFWLDSISLCLKQKKTLPTRRSTVVLHLEASPYATFDPILSQAVFIDFPTIVSVVDIILGNRACYVHILGDNLDHAQKGKKVPSLYLQRSSEEKKRKEFSQPLYQSCLARKATVISLMITCASCGGKSYSTNHHMRAICRALVKV